MERGVGEVDNEHHESSYVGCFEAFAVGMGERD